MRKGGRLRNFGLILAFLLVFGLMFYFANRGDSGVLLDSTQIYDVVFTGGYSYEATDKDGNVTETKVETGYVTDMYCSGGVCYIRVQKTDLGNKAFPKFADYYFTYARTNSQTLEYFYEFNKMVDYAKANPSATTYGEGENARSIIGYKDLNKISITEIVPKESFMSTAMPYIIMIVIVCISGFLMVKLLSKQGGGHNSFTRNKAKMIEKCSVRFSDVAGADEEKEETKEIVEFLKDPAKFRALGARIPKGVLLVGNPGTGKTLLAKAVAGESNVPFFSISGSDFVELYVGVGASRVRDLFETAKRNAPCIIFIDEIDAVGRQRGTGVNGGNDEREQTLNQLLVEMDGFDSDSGIIILAATNRADVLDPALLRPGRFDRQIYVNVPDVKGREGIIEIHAKNKPIEKSVNFKDIARLTSGFTGADIENFLNEAAILAARDNRLTITMEDITEGINKVLMGPQKKSRLVTENDKKLTAYHEGGHAIIAKFMDCGDTVHEVSIIPRGQAGGYTNIRPSDDDSHYSLNKLKNRISMMMGGRIAEEIVFGDITAGASSDIQRATELARRMVVEWGMSEKLGFMSFTKDRESYFATNQYSEATAKVIDEEIKKIIDDCYKQAKELLQSQRKLLDNMADLLLKEETIYAEEVDELIAGVEPSEIEKRLHEKEQKRKEREDEIRKEQDLLKQAKLQELKIKAAEALKDAGVIGQAEFDKLKSDYEKINKEKDEFFKNRNDSLKEKIESKIAEQKKLEEESLSSDKEKQVSDAVVKEKSTTKKTTKSTTTKKSSTAKSKNTKGETKKTRTKKSSEEKNTETKAEKENTNNAEEDKNDLDKKL